MHYLASPGELHKTFCVNKKSERSLKIHFSLFLICETVKDFRRWSRNEVDASLDFFLQLLSCIFRVFFIRF